MSYGNVIGGGLKLKGVTTSKNKKRKLEEDSSEQAKKKEKETTEEEEEDSPIPKTKAEIAFERMQKLRQSKIVSKKAAKSHRQKVEEFNLKLANLSEHYDIPKVGPG